MSLAARAAELATALFEATDAALVEGLADLDGARPEARAWLLTEMSRRRAVARRAPVNLEAFACARVAR